MAVAYTLYFYYLHVSTLEVRMAHSDVSLQGQADGQHDGTWEKECECEKYLREHMASHEAPSNDPIADMELY